MQTKLNKYFSIKTEFSGKHKKCFIYDVAKSNAIFEVEPMDTDEFIVKKLGICLYIRGTTQNYEFPALALKTDVAMPLLKSNLQKAIRRGINIVAMASALAIWQLDPIELLRRLAIICIEDVCVMDAYPVLIWLMMADTNYKTRTTDIYIILKLVNMLCNCSKSFDHSLEAKDCVYTHESLQDNKRHDVLLALFYRQKYGGMKGDMEMLTNAIAYYSVNYKHIVKIDVCDIDCDFEGGLEILDAAIDFHPFPWILENISKKSGLEKSLIQEFIWFAESAVNFRKLHTLVKSESYRRRLEWCLIEKYLGNERAKI
jgi:hypothetical protein